ncbi:hypothetical protein [Parvibaculum sp.]|nr:hypothetical protein [Parvibaculum sp.]
MKSQIERARAAWRRHPCVQDHTWRWGILALLLIGLMLMNGGGR